MRATSESWRAGRRARGRRRGRCPVGLRAQAIKQPVYVGSRACARCHEGKAAGNQYSHWLDHGALEGLGLARDARGEGDGAASAASPTSRRRRRSASAATRPPPTRRSGSATRASASRTASSARSATARAASTWTRRSCATPRPRAAPGCASSRSATARSATTSRARTSRCTRKPALDVDKAWEALAHPRSAGRRHPGRARPCAPAEAAAVRRAEVRRVVRLRACHQGPGMGYQLSLWRMSPHAQAYAVLSTPRGPPSSRRRPASRTRRSRPRA